MLTEKLTRILRSKSSFSEQEISQMTESDGWKWVYKDKAPKTKEGKHITEVCFTGFPDSERSDLLRLAARSELVVVGSVTRKLSFLVEGQYPGSAKHEKAEKQGVLIMTLDQFKQFLQTGEIPDRSPISC